MKELAIYGDSYAECNAPHGWSYLLQQTNPSGIDIFAKGGSGIDWSFNNFLNTHSNYEKIVFVVTTHGRIHYPIECTSKEDGTIKIFEHWPGIKSLEWVMEKYTSKNNLLEDLFAFFVEYSHYQFKYAKNTNKAIIRYVKHMRPDAVIIPAFRQAIIGESPDPELDLEYNKWSFYDIGLNETSKFASEAIWDNTQDPRCNHFTRESNKWVLKHVEARLNGQFINWDQTQTPVFSDFESLKLES
jgi:hypothetical protein